MLNLTPGGTLMAKITYGKHSYHSNGKQIFSKDQLSNHPNILVPTVNTFISLHGWTYVLLSQMRRISGSKHMYPAWDILRGYTKECDIREGVLSISEQKTANRTPPTK
jgi:hypothetical protein